MTDDPDPNNEWSYAFRDAEERRSKPNSGKGADGAPRPFAPRFPLVKFDDILMSTTSFYLVKKSYSSIRACCRLWTAEVREELLGL